MLSYVTSVKVFMEIVIISILNGFKTRQPYVSIARGFRYSVLIIYFMTVTKVVMFVQLKKSDTGVAQLDNILPVWPDYFQMLFISSSMGKV